MSDIFRSKLVLGWVWALLATGCGGRMEAVVIGHADEASGYDGDASESEAEPDDVPPPWVVDGSDDEAPPEDEAPDAGTPPSDDPSPSGNKLPKAAFTVRVEGLKVTVDASSSSDPDGQVVAYRWAWGDGQSASGVKPAPHTYASAGTKDITLTVTDDTGGQRKLSRSVTVVQVGAKPGPSTTGVPAGTSLRKLTAMNRPYPKDVFSGSKFIIHTANAVYDAWQFDALVEVRAPGVTFTRCFFRGVPVTPKDSALLFVHPAPANAGQPSAEVEDSTFIPSTPSNHVDGVRGSNFVLRRVEITDTVDGVHIHGTSDRKDVHAGNVVVEDSWIHDLPHYDDTSHPDGTHNDAVQIVGGRNIVLRNNRFDGVIYNAALMVTQGWNDVSKLTVTGNWAAGGGCTFNIYDKNVPSPIADLVMTNNIFTRGSTTYSDCAMIVTQGTRALTTATGNVWHDGSTPPPTMRNGG